MVIGVTSSNVPRRRSAPRSAGVVLLRSIVFRGAFATRALVATDEGYARTSTRSVVLLPNDPVDSALDCVAVQHS